MIVKHFIEDKILLFQITEELDHHNSERIRNRADYEIQRVIFDFKKVSFMDSAGIGLIIGRYKQTNCFGGKLEVVNVNSKIRKVFEMSGILNIIPILDDFEVEKIS